MLANLSALNQRNVDAVTASVEADTGWHAMSCTAWRAGADLAAAAGVHHLAQHPAPDGVTRPSAGNRGRIAAGNLSTDSAAGR